MEVIDFLNIFLQINNNMVPIEIRGITVFEHNNSKGIFDLLKLQEC